MGDFEEDNVGGDEYAQPRAEQGEENSTKPEETEETQDKPKEESEEPKKSKDKSKKSPKKKKHKKDRRSSKSRDSKTKDRDHDKDRSRSRDKDKRRSSRDRDKKKDKSRDKDRKRSRTRSPKKHRHRSRSRSRSRKKSSRRRRSRSRSRSREREKEKKSKLKFDPEAIQNVLQGVNRLQELGGPNALLYNLPDNNAQVTRQSRRLYVGNLPVGMGLNEKILTEFFNTTVTSLGIATPNPVLSVWLQTEGTFCFVEFRGVQDASTCMTLLQGITIGGRSLRVGRPADYKPPPPGLENFIVGVHPQAWGNPALTGALASAGLTGFGGPPLPSDGSSTVLLLMNMVNEKELGPDDEFLDLILDVREECEKFGEVHKVVIPRPKAEGKDDDPESAKLEGIGNDRGPRVDGPAVGRIFVQYKDLKGCTTAKESLNNRLFNGRKVEAQFYNYAEFINGNFNL